MTPDSPDNLSVKFVESVGNTGERGPPPRFRTPPWLVEDAVLGREWIHMMAERSLGAGVGARTGRKE